MEQSALTADHFDRIVVVVAALARHHDDEPARSLSASGASAGPARVALRQVADADVQATLEEASTALDGAGDPCHPVAEPPGSGPRFRVLRLLATGGLGEVFIAHDEGLNRPVALKVIQARHARSHDKRARFLLEAEVTGRLEHPGIVPVYGLGRRASDSATGAPGVGRVGDHWPA